MLGGFHGNNENDRWAFQKMKCMAFWRQKISLDNVVTNFLLWGFECEQIVVLGFFKETYFLFCWQLGVFALNGVETRFTKWRCNGV
jgi:hypothetical protein